MIATATHTHTKLTRLVDVLETTADRVSVSWTLGTRVEFDAATGRGLGRVRDWILGNLHGSEQLAQWLCSTGYTQKWLADQLGCAPSAVNKWLKVDIIPQEPMAEAIEEITGIPAHAWRRVAR